MAWILETERLVVRHFSQDDAAFILQLLNEPSFIEHIADKGVRTLDDAQNYLRQGPLASYARNGFGLNRVALKTTGEAIGMCGLIRRDDLTDVDIGYAFLPGFCNRGYAREAVRAVLDSGACQHGLQRVIAVANPDNANSITLLDKIGFQHETSVTLPGETTPIHQFGKLLRPCMRLTPPYAEQYRALMLQAYDQHPDAFTSSAAERAALPMPLWEARLRTAPDASEVVFGAFQDGKLAGAAGLVRETREKTRHKATLFGMVVQPAYQRRGLGQHLVQAVLEHARSLPGLRHVVLTVTQGNTPAEKLYAAHGFERFGVEPDAVNVGNAFVAKVHMWCPLLHPGRLNAA